jgi:hypothetical protein
MHEVNRSKFKYNQMTGCLINGNDLTRSNGENTSEKYTVHSVGKRTIPAERPPFVSEVRANFFTARGCHVVSVTNPYGRILGFLDRSRYYCFQVAPQLYSRG